MPGTESRDVHLVLEALSRFVPLARATLPAEFFPAHVSVAVIDAVFGSRRRHGARSASMSERYCRYFALACRRANQWAWPPVDAQEPLGDLLERYDELGADAFARTVFQIRPHGPNTKRTSAERVERIARILQRMGVDTLQDVQARRPAELVDALRSLPGVGAHTTRWFLMYIGDDGFVLGDRPVRRFVASAVGRRTVSATHAEALVRSAAHELLLSPRLLDCAIWRDGPSGTGVARAPHPPDGRTPKW